MRRILLLSLFASLALVAQTKYKQPPEAILKVLRAPATPIPSVNPAKTHLLLLEPDRYPPIAELAQPMLRLAGLRINPRNNGPRNPRASYKAVELINLTTLGKQAVPLPAGARFSAAEWNPQGDTAAFVAMFEDRLELYLLDVKTAQLRAVPKVRLNAAYGEAMSWLPGGRSMLVQTIPAQRGKAPEAPLVPAGPDIQESFGKATPAPTYQDLLKSEHDEALFEYYGTSQLAVVEAATGRTTLVGQPGLFGSAEASPNGQHYLVTKVHRPFSWVLPVERFPEDVEVWDQAGKTVASIAKLPLADRVPLEGVRTGPRNVQWYPTEGATLLWVEALDGGNPKETVPHRDRVLMAQAPFTSPREVTKLEKRAMGRTNYLRDGRMLASDYDRKTKRLRMFLVDPTKSPAQVDEVLSRNMQDRYRDMGTAVTELLPSGQRVVVSEGDFAFFTGDGASPQGDRPFLDRVNLKTKAKERLFACGDGVYESVVNVLDKEGKRLITRRESTTEPPNFFLLAGGKRTALTSFVDPAPEMRQVKKQLVNYQRADGVPLSFTLYLPPGYKPGTPLPTVLWAYPREYNDADTAGQINGSPYRFTQLAGASHLFYLLAGYAILDDAALPVIGDPETANNTYLEQIVAGAKAAIDKAAAMGVTDPKRVGVGGHSYGGFMTANLLAHSDLFAAGVARSGAYNRTLTPFGFQAERRTLWEAPATYLGMSPFLSAHKINEPILLIHGQADNNTGTFPIQSERMYAAIRGNGGTVRFVYLPFESHGYAARESVEHTLAEMVEWFDKHVKNRAE